MQTLSAYFFQFYFFKATFRYWQPLCFFRIEFYCINFLSTHLEIGTFHNPIFFSRAAKLNFTPVKTKLIEIFGFYTPISHRLGIMSEIAQFSSTGFNLSNTIRLLVDLLLVTDCINISSTPSVDLPT